MQWKRDLKSHPQFKSRNDEANEWFYWNRIWASEVALSEYLIHEFFPHNLKGKTILELGCGCGLAGMVSAKLGGTPTFSDKVPMVMESVQEGCRQNGIANYRTWVLDWTNVQGKVDQYDIVLGSEVFYDTAFMANISHLLERVLAPGGIGLFCDPNRLGVDVLEDYFGSLFILTTRHLTVDWPRIHSGKPKPRKVMLYALKRKPSPGE